MPKYIILKAWKWNDAFGCCDSMYTNRFTLGVKLTELLIKIKNVKWFSRLKILNICIVW